MYIYAYICILTIRVYVQIRIQCYAYLVGVIKQVIYNFIGQYLHIMQKSEDLFGHTLPLELWI